MHKANGPFFRIQQKNRNAIGRTNYKCNPRLIGNHPIDTCLILWLPDADAALCTPNSTDYRMVVLGGCNKGIHFKSSSTAEAPVVFTDIFVAVPAPECKIHGGKLIFADTA